MKLVENIIQPRDRKDPLYALVAEYWCDGDAKEIIKKLKIKNIPQVYDVKSGRRRNARIWRVIVENTYRRIEARANMLKYAQSVKEAA